MGDQQSAWPEADKRTGHYGLPVYTDGAGGVTFLPAGKKIGDFRCCQYEDPEQGGRRMHSTVWPTSRKAFPVLVFHTGNMDVGVQATAHVLD